MGRPKKYYRFNRYGSIITIVGNGLGKPANPNSQ